MPYLEFEPVPSAQAGVPDFVVRVESSQIRGDRMPVPLVTRYKDFPYKPRARANEAWTQDYIFVDDRPGARSDEQPEGPMLWEFYFTLDRSAIFRKPISYLTDPCVMMHEWPDVMVRMGFIEDATQPLTFEVGGQVKEVARLFERFVLIPGGVYATKMKTEVFLSDQPFPDNFFKLDIPVPTLVTWNLRNSSGSQRCLHPHIRFPETQTGGSVLNGAGTFEKPITIMEGQDFPATNHVTWQPHVCDEQVSQVNGVRRCVRTTITQAPAAKLLKY